MNNFPLVASFKEAYNTLLDRNLRFRYRIIHLQEPFRDVLLKIGYIKPLSDEENKKLLEAIAYTFIDKGGMNVIKLNLMMFKFTQQLRWRIDVRLPYYWGPYGIHVVYGEFTNKIRANNAYFNDDLRGNAS